jgi:peroxiredoxin
MTLLPDVERAIVDAIERDQEPRRAAGLAGHGVTGGLRRRTGRPRWTRARCLALAVGGVASVTAVAAASGVIGHLAPDADVRLPVLGTHRSAALADYRGETVVVTLYATWCIPCRVEAKILDRLGREMRASRAGTAVLIDEQDPARAAWKFAAREGLSLPILSDRNGAIATAYGVRGIPETFVLDPGGRVAAKLLGTTDEATLRGEVARVERRGR